MFGVGWVHIRHQQVAAAQPGASSVCAWQLCVYAAALWKELMVHRGCLDKWSRPLESMGVRVGVHIRQQQVEAQLHQLPQSVCVCGSFEAPCGTGGAHDAALRLSRPTIQ